MYNVIDDAACPLRHPLHSSVLSSSFEALLSYVLSYKYLLRSMKSVKKEYPLGHNKKPDLKDLRSRCSLGLYNISVHACDDRCEAKHHVPCFAMDLNDLSGR